jgi:hypothetical protein
MGNIRYYKNNCCVNFRQQICFKFNFANVLLLLRSMNLISLILFHNNVYFLKKLIQVTDCDVCEKAFQVYRNKLNKIKA